MQDIDRVSLSYLWSKFISNVPSCPERNPVLLPLILALAYSTGSPDPASTTFNVMESQVIAAYETFEIANNNTIAKIDWFCIKLMKQYDEIM